MKFASWTYDGGEVDLRSVDKSFSIKPNTTNAPETARLVQESLNLNSTLNQVDNQNLSSNQNNSASKDSIKFNKQIQRDLKSNLKSSDVERVEIGIDMSDFYTSVEW